MCIAKSTIDITIPDVTLQRYNDKSYYYLLYIKNKILFFICASSGFLSKKKAPQGALFSNYNVVLFNH